jgi:hypothetical protein
MRDFYSHIEPVLTFGPVALTADATGATVDLLGFESAVIDLEVGIGGITFTASNKVEFVAEHSDDGTNWTKLEDKHVQGVTGIVDGKIKSLVAAHAAPAAYRYGYHGGRRYLRVSPDFSGTHGAATPLACAIIKGRPSRAVA